MELRDDPAPARWSEPRAAYVRFRPGLSPYLHYFYDLHADPGMALPAAEEGRLDGADLPSQFEEALQALIRDSLK